MGRNRERAFVITSCTTVLIIIGLVDGWSETTNLKKDRRSCAKRLV